MLEYYYPWPNSAGLYAAREKGLYSRNGLDVDFALFDAGRGDTLTYLAAGDADFGLFPMNRLLVLEEKRPSVVSIAAVNHRAMETIQTVRGKGVTRPRDLEGRKIGLAPTPRGLAMVRTLIAADGGDPDAVGIFDTGAREWLARDIRDAGPDEPSATFGTYWAWDVLIDRTVPDEDRIIWPVDEIGAPKFHSYLLGARRDIAASEPETVRAFTEATVRGYDEVRKDPDFAVFLYAKVAPYLPAEAVRKSVGLLIPTWYPQGTADFVFGTHNAAFFDEYADWLAANGILKDANIRRTSYTNEFLPKGDA
jgi:NitT/TauT family transport system substrate-binding protein